MTGKTLAEWGAAILDFLGLDKLLRFIPSPLNLKAYFKQITDFLNVYEPIVDSILVRRGCCGWLLRVSHGSAAGITTWHCMRMTLALLPPLQNKMVDELKPFLNIA